ncbi:MAG TPA: molybdopterin-dependent oxidoreductase [Candidatus Sulfotelmatobacter sp.]|nr:molybdopterin-dependent oxidoreductase [Candidatus Sulfotelmatobacter sp.]
MKSRSFGNLLVSLLLSAALAQCQQLKIQTGNGKETVLERPDIESLPHVKVTTHGSDMSAEFEGVALKAVLEKAGVEFGHSMRGKRVASCLLVEAADGYRAVIALPEMDPDFTDKQIVLAFLQSGKPLDAKAGPYRIVIPDEKRMARWVRQVTKLKIVDVQ